MPTSLISNFIKICFVVYGSVWLKIELSLQILGKVFHIESKKNANTSGTNDAT